MQNEVYALITGSSKGIGKAMALECASRKMNVLLVALPNEDLKDTSKEIKELYKVKSDFLEIDLAETKGPENVLKWCENQNYNVNILINNAGLAGTAIFDKSEPSYTDTIIQLNIRALVLLTRFFIPILKKESKGYILNIGSMAAFYAIPYKSTYAASKAFVVSFSTAINDELKDTSVQVSVVCPNGVETNNATYSRIKSHGYMGNITKITAENLATYSMTKMFEGKTFIIPKRINKFLFVLEKIIPKQLLQFMLLKEFKKEAALLK